MTELFIPTDHEHVQIKPGKRTGLPVMIAIHSTVLGPAIGGLRIKHYDRASDGLSDVLRLSQAMSVKAAAIDNGTGGGKAVVPLPTGFDLSTELREAVLLDVADHVHALDGAYHAAPDVGTGPSDIDVIRRRTPYAGGYSKEAGGSGGTTFGTFIGLETAIQTALRTSFGRSSVSGLRVSIVGLGGIGKLLARAYAAEGAHLIVSDIDLSARSLAEELNAEWMTPDQAMLAECDLLVPCALGGVLTPEVVASLRTPLICGAANNQLATESVATALKDRSIIYVPDFIANAGGLMHASAIEYHHRTPEGAEVHTRGGIARNVALVLAEALSKGITTQDAALNIAWGRIRYGSRRVV